jgi:pimeloyl-ACP methyl ester carboxylesterase
MRSAATVEGALEVALAECRMTSSCAGPDLLGRYDQLAATLEQSPIEVEVVDPWTSDQRRRSASVDGETLEKGVFGLLYSNDADITLPRWISAAREGDVELLQQGVIAQLWWTRGDFGAFLSQLCAEGGWNGTTDDLSAAFADLPRIAGDAWERHRGVHASQCELWGVRPRARATPVQSDVPTLLLAGTFDPITPPRWAAEVASRMPTATLRVFAGTGHGVLFGGPPCADEIAGVFVADPNQRLDSDCGLPVIP